MLNDPRARTLHLYGRAGMGLTPSELAVCSARSHAELVEELFEHARSWEPLRVDHTPIDPRGYRRLSKVQQTALRRTNQEESRRLNRMWMRQLARTEGCLREKMALFWHGHFACWTHWSLSAEHYLNTLREHALGDFRQLLKAVSRAPAMLEYLNNQQNRKGAPNENFAREVMELFTLGRGHYSEHDIKEAARAFTGWGFEPGTDRFVFRELQHDDGMKEFRGRTGAFTGEDILDMLTEDRRCAEFVSRKIYRWFVHPEVDEAFVADMARRFFESGYDIGALMRHVLLSDHFLADRNRGSLVRSPVDLLCGLDKLFHFAFADDRTPILLQRALGQELLHPPSVAGWTLGNGWIDANALLTRLKLPSVLLNNGELEWEDPSGTADDMDRMVQAEEPDMPLRDRRGRRIDALVDREGFLAQLDEGIPNEDLLATLLVVEASPGLRRNLSAHGVWDRCLLILSSPEYQLC